MSLSYVTLTVDIYDGQGSVPTSGTATFTPSATLTDTTNHEIVAQLPVVVSFKPSGPPTIRLLATDNATLTPGGWAWQVTFSGSGMPSAFSFFLPFSGGASQNLSSIIPVATSATASGPLIISATPGGTPTGLPIGRSLSVGLTGLQIVSSYPSDDVNPGGTDGTGRIELYSYQRANASGFGETIRNFLMRWDAKANTAWYGPVSLYDGSGNAITGAGWTAWSWAGAHYEANDHGSIHGHYEIEVPDATLALQGRLIIPFADDDPTSGTYGQVGLTKTNVRVNQADFTADSAWGVIRVGGSAGVNDRTFELASSIYGRAAAVRWRVVANNTAEGGSDAGSDLAIRRFSDSGGLLGTALFVRRSDGQSSMGSASPLGARLALVWGGNIHGYSAQPSSSPVTSAAYDAQMTATTDRAFQTQVTGDTNRRLIVTADGKLSLGPGNATQDTNIYRASAGVLQTDDTIACRRPTARSGTPSVRRGQPRAVISRGTATRRT